MTRPIVLGAGPAGSAAAILLARGGSAPTLIDRDEVVGDALCGGFMSWRTVAALRDLGLDPAALGAHRVERLALFAGDIRAEAALPEPAWGLSRRALDTALREQAVASGVQLEIDRARRVSPGVIEGERRSWRAGAIFLATGKHDVRGERRPRAAADPALGVRIRIPASPALADLLAHTIELHFFDRGYAGIVLHEDGSANICLALRKSLLAKNGGTPRALLDRLAERHPAFRDRMVHAAPDLPIDTVGAVPYGWIARDTAAGLYRLGDQAAVIPSLAGEGMGIALASGRAAAEGYLAGNSARDYQRAFARRARRPVGVAGLTWKLGETGTGASLIAGLVSFAPGIARMAMGLTRI